MPNHRSFSATASRFALVPIAAALISTLVASSAGAITPAMPLRVEPSGATQPEHAATSLAALYAAIPNGQANAGAGVKVAIIDSGIPVYPKNHLGGTEAFAVRTHSCFTDTGYPKTRQLGDTRFTNNKVIAARVFWYPPRKASSSGGIDEVAATAEAVTGHGSHVAGIVGCNSNTPAMLNGTRTGTISGIAPRVQFGSYNVFPGRDGATLGPTPDLIADAVDAAVADGMHIINMSLGNVPSDDGDVVIDAVQRAERAGVLVIVAAGNDGPDAGTVDSPGNSPSVVTVGSVDGGRELRTTITYGSTSISAPVGRIGIPVRAVSAPLAIAGGGAEPSLACSSDQIGDEVRGKIAVVARGECFFYDKLFNLRSAGALGVVLISQQGRAPVALSSENETVINIASAMVSYEDGAALIDAARRGTKASFTIPTLTAAGNVNHVSSFSSAGPAPVTHVVKPDLVAPGAEILSATTGTLEQNCTTSGTCFMLMSGTSMATPYVTGVAALLKQLHPRWSLPMLRSALIHTASAGSVIAADVNQAGLGLVDPLRANAADFGINVTSLVVTPASTHQLGLISASRTPVALTVSSSESWLSTPTAYTVRPYAKNAQIPVRIASDAPPGAIGFLTLRSATTELRIAVRVLEGATR